MNQELFKEHFNIRIQIKELEEAEEKIKLQIMEVLDKLETRSFLNHYGTWSIVPKITYKYSSEAETKLLALKEKINHVKQDDETSGKAVATETPFIRFQAVKLAKGNY